MYYICLKMFKRCNSVINLHAVQDLRLCGEQAAVKKLLSGQNEEISGHIIEAHFSLRWKQNCFGTENNVNGIFDLMTYTSM